MNNVRKLIAGAAIGASAITGAGIGAALVAGAASADTTTTTPAASTAATDSGSTAAAPPAAAPRDASQGGHVGANGVKEVVLTGDTATKVSEAALAAVPGATIERVENDAEGAVYEAHIKKADGTEATVKLDASFKVTSIEDGHK
jgi:uncharacterized membrane protein YkoI